MSVRFFFLLGMIYRALEEPGEAEGERCAARGGGQSIEDGRGQQNRRVSLASVTQKTEKVVEDTEKSEGLKYY